MGKNSSFLHNNFFTTKCTQIHFVNFYLYISTLWSTLSFRIAHFKFIIIIIIFYLPYVFTHTVCVCIYIIYLSDYVFQVNYFLKVCFNLHHLLTIYFLLEANLLLLVMLAKLVFGIQWHNIGKYVVFIFLVINVCESENSRFIIFVLVDLKFVSNVYLYWILKRTSELKASFSLLISNHYYIFQVKMHTKLL